MAKFQETFQRKLQYDFAERQASIFKRGNSGLLSSETSQNSLLVIHLIANIIVIFA